MGGSQDTYSTGSLLLLVTTRYHYTLELFERNKSCFPYNDCKYKLDSAAANALGTLSKPRRQQQQERHQTKGLTSKTMAVHFRFKSLYISLPCSAKQERVLPAGSKTRVTFLWSQVQVTVLVIGN